MEYKQSYGNLFIDIFSFVNKIFTVEDYLLNKVPDDILKYLYISDNVEIDGGRYINFNNENLNIYVIKTNEDKGFYSNIILFHNIPTLILLIPAYLEPNDKMVDRRSHMIEFLYRFIFDYMTKRLGGRYRRTILGNILNYSPLILPALTERHLGLEPNIKYYCRNDKDVEKLISESAKYSIDELFRYGALSGIIKEIKANK